ncbi:FAD/NAD(P)-binding domain-containing protein [Xylariaceae sp. FL0016]|nr:FAD/NAD(P)-binding domain-containing protein [Xylariaceae sp. FL0016]
MSTITRPRILPRLSLFTSPGASRAARKATPVSLSSLSLFHQTAPASNAMGSAVYRDTEAHAIFNVKKIAIVGAGPSGLAAAKYLLAEDVFKLIDIYEEQAEIGGVWNYSATAAQHGTLHVPQTDAHGPPDPPIASSGREDGDYELDSDEEGCTAPGSGLCSRPSPAMKREGTGKGPPLFPSPMYDDLHTNIPQTLMKYSDLDFPQGCKIFPSRQVVQDYIIDYAKDVRHLVKFSTQVTNISLHDATVLGIDQGQNQIQEQWDLSFKNLQNGDEHKVTYDAVVIASGHYSTPHIPSVHAMEAFNDTNPGVISHSKYYRTAEAYRNKRVMVVGTGPSGLDIAAQIARVSTSPLYLSARTMASPETLAHLGSGVRQVGEIARFLPSERGVEVASKSASETITDLDAIIFCTGYLYTFPFLKSPLNPPLITNGLRVHGLARHFLHIAHPSLVFPALPMKVIPFPLAEAQAAVFARLWSNRLPLPSKEVLGRMRFEDGERTGAGAEGDKGFHVFPKGEDGRYLNEMHEWAMAARVGKDGDGGKEPPFWGEREMWERSIYAQAKMRFESEGKTATTLEELGFRFEAGVDGAVADGRNGEEPGLNVAG